MSGFAQESGLFVLTHIVEKSSGWKLKSIQLTGSIEQNAGIRSVFAAIMCQVPMFHASVLTVPQLVDPLRNQKLSIQGLQLWLTFGPWSVRKERRDQWIQKDTKTVVRYINLIGLKFPKKCESLKNHMSGHFSGSASEENGFSQLYAVTPSNWSSKGKQFTPSATSPMTALIQLAQFHHSRIEATAILRKPKVGISHFCYMGVSKNRGTPKWMVYNGKPY